MGNNYEVFQAKLEDILELRQKVLLPDKAVEEALFEGDRDSRTVHFAVYEVTVDKAPTGPPLCCASFMQGNLYGTPKRLRAWQLRGMATDFRYQRRGLGEKLLRHALRVLAQKGPRYFWCNARLSAVRFYLKIGWTITGDPFEIPGVGPHRWMYKQMPVPYRRPGTKR